MPPPGWETRPHREAGEPRGCDLPAAEFNLTRQAQLPSSSLIHLVSRGGGLRFSKASRPQSRLSIHRTRGEEPEAADKESRGQNQSGTEVP